MNEELAKMYGNVPDEDVEKQASANLTEQLSGEGAFDTNGLTDDQIEELAKSVIAGDGEQEVKTAGAEGEQLSDEDKQKLAEADYLGRVMAHAFVAEQRDIEKTAGLKEVGGKVVGHLKTLASKARAAGSRGVEKGRAGAQAVGEHVKRHPKKYMGAGAAGAAGAGFAAGRMSKKSSATPAIDQLAIARAQEILEANGINPEEAEPIGEKTAAPQNDEDKAAVLANAVEARAIQLLKDQGYQIEEEG